MSISAKKINQMLIDEFSKSDNYEENIRLLNEISRQIYVIESKFDGGSDRQKIEEIRDLIALRANEFIIK